MSGRSDDIELAQRCVDRAIDFANDAFEGGTFDTTNIERAAHYANVASAIFARWETK